MHVLAWNITFFEIKKTYQRHIKCMNRGGKSRYLINGIGARKNISKTYEMYKTEWKKSWFLIF